MFNAHYGAHEDLPFDLRHRGGAIVFTLPPGASTDSIKSEKRRLTREFAARLAHYVATPGAPSPATFIENPPTNNRAAYFNPSEVLAEVGVRDVDLIQYSHEAKALAYLRLIPTASMERPLPLSMLREVVASAPTFSSQYGGLSAINRFGPMLYVPKTRPRKGHGLLSDSTQLFDNGEIWSVSASLIVAEEDRGDRPAWVKLPMIHSLTFEDRFYHLIRNMTSFALESMGLRPPFQVEAGFVGVEGAHIAFPDPEFWKVRRADIIHRALLNNVEHATLDSFLLDFFEKVYDATGYKRPKELNGFPPGRPTARQSR